MSDSDKDDDQPEVQKDVNELTKEIEDKCWEAFNTFDKESTGTI